MHLKIYSALSENLLLNFFSLNTEHPFIFMNLSTVDGLKKSLRFELFLFFYWFFRSYCLKLWQHVALIDLLFKHLWELSDTVSKINYRNELYFNCYHHLLWTKEADSQLPFFLDSQSKYIEWQKWFKAPIKSNIQYF